MCHLTQPFALQHENSTFLYIFILIVRLFGVSYLFIYVITEPGGYALDHLMFNFLGPPWCCFVLTWWELHAWWEWYCQAWSKCILLGVGCTAFSIWIAHTSDCSYWTILGANKLPCPTDYFATKNGIPFKWEDQGSANTGSRSCCMSLYWRCVLRIY